MNAAAAGPSQWPEERTALLPYVPLVHWLWADGVLSEAEYREARRHVEGQPWLDDADRQAVLAWLDPERPPSPSALLDIEKRMRAVALGEGERAGRTLSDLGLALWSAAGESGPWSDPAAVQALRRLEADLGVLGPESVRHALGLKAGAAPGAPSQPAKPGVDARAIRALLERDRPLLREEVASLLAHPALTIPLGLPLPEYRERVLEAVRFLAERGLGRRAYPREFGGEADPGGAVAVFETLAFGDASVLVKFGVQFGLFGGSVLQLGTEEHHQRYLSAIGSLELPGCYAMTETGHGSNVRDLETTATYDRDTDELVVHTPHEGAGKDWIGNAGLHGRLATVFARLVVGDDDHGVHAVLVPIRGPDGVVPPGIRIEDRGLKEGLNGVDNGRIWFDGVRVPRENLLDRFGAIDEDGRYRSSIPSPGRRFFTMLRTLVSGRVSVAAAAVSAAKVGLTIAVRYTSERRQFGPDGAPEVPLLDYPALQRALMPRLATTIGLHFAIRELQASHADPARAGDPAIEAEAAGLKAYASEHCVATLQACREACGGQGYAADNRFGALMADTDVFTTFEGANLVLYQLVARGLLSRFREEMGDLTLRRAMRYVVERAETRLTQLNPITTRRSDADHLLDPAFHAAALAYREQRLLGSAARRLRARIDDGMDSFQALLECQDHLIALARAHVEALVQERFERALSTAPELTEALRPVSALYALERLEAGAGWFLETGYIESAKAKAIRDQVGRLCGEVRAQAHPLVDALGVPDAVLPEWARGARA